MPNQFSLIRRVGTVSVYRCLKLLTGMNGLKKYMSDINQQVTCRHHVTCACVRFLLFASEMHTIMDSKRQLSDVKDALDNMNTINKHYVYIHFFGL
jgi:hypothetical protein